MEITLSNREYDVLSLMAKGLTDLEIANSLFIGTTTVKTHTYNIYQKLMLSYTPRHTMRVRAVLMYFKHKQEGKIWQI